MFKIAVEEAFATPEILQMWAAVLEDGAPGEIGLVPLLGRLLNPTEPWGARVADQLTDLDEARLAQMDEGGIDMQLIALTAPGVQVFDADTANALARDTNDVLADAVGRHPTRFAGLAAVAPQAPQTAAKELERAMGLGFKGLLINSHTKGEYLDGLSYRPILEAAASLNAPLYIHPRSAPPAMQAPFAERHMEGAIWGFQTDTALHALRLIVSGVFDEYPNLQIVLGHLGEAVPFWLDRLDRQVGRSSREVFRHWKAERLPSDYFRENFWVSTSGHNWDPAVRFVEEVVGEDRLMFAADYPYESCAQQAGQAAGITLKNPDKFYHLNAKRVFNLA